MDTIISKLEKKKTKSGFLVEFLKRTELNTPNTEFSLIYVVKILPGNISGNHFHKEKTEWMSIFNGKVNVVLEDVKTKEREEFVLDSSKELTRLLIRKGLAHAFKNISNKDVILVAYSDKIYDPENSDTYDYKLL